MYYLKGLRFDRTGLERKAVTFGSMVGKGGAHAMIAEDLDAYGFDVIDSQEIVFVPNDEEQTASFNLGVKLAQKYKKL